MLWCTITFFFFHERLTSLFIVYQTMLTIGESRLISEANERERQAREHSIQQAAEKRHCSKNGDLKLSSNHTVAKFVFFSNFFLSSFLSHFFISFVAIVHFCLLCTKTESIFLKLLNLKQNLSPSAEALLAFTDVFFSTDAPV